MMLTSKEAARLLAMLDFAAARSPEAPFAFLRGYLVRASGEPLERSEAEPRDTDPQIARVTLKPRSPK